MKKSRLIFGLLTGLSLFFTIGVVLYSQTEDIPLKMLIIYGLIGLVAVISIILALRKIREEKQGQPLEDEFTTKIKHKAGYYAYISSLYMWLFLFLLRGWFPDVETLVGGGVMLSALIGFICKQIVKNKPNAQ